MHQIGAVLYLAWGGLHLLAAHQVYKLGSETPSGMVQGRIFQSAWNLAFFAMFVSIVAVVFNWHNSSLGYWLNLTLASVIDIGFIFVLLSRGYVPLWPGAIGPVLWLLATFFSTLGMLGIAA